MNSDDQTSSDRLGDENNSGTAASANNDPRGLPRTRGDKGNLHITRHGILSRYPLQALKNRGVDIRSLRRDERAFRAEVQPQGALGKILFDRAWSSYLKGILAELLQAELMSSAHGATEIELRLVPRDVPTLVWDQKDRGSGLSTELLDHLAIVLRYDTHYAREFYRAMALLLAMKGKEDTLLKRLLAKTGDASRDLMEDLDE